MRTGIIKFIVEGYGECFNHFKMDYLRTVNNSTSNVLKHDEIPLNEFEYDVITKLDFRLLKLILTDQSVGDVNVSYLIHAIRLKLKYEN